MSISKSNLKEYAAKLMFDMEDEEYSVLQNEFDIVLQHMELINKIDGISDIEPMTFPFKVDNINLREDIIANQIAREDALRNAKEVENNEIRVPKVVG